MYITDLGKSSREETLNIAVGRRHDVGASSSAALVVKANVGVGLAVVAVNGLFPYAVE